MTDIERLKKLNKMIPEMKKHGFADTFDEAAKKTEEMFAEKFPGNQSQEPQSQVKEPTQVDQFDRFRQVVESRLNQIEANVSSTISKINEMVKSFNEIEQRFTELKNNQQKSIPSVKQEPVQTTITESKVEEPKKQTEKTHSKEDTPDPKNGDFTPDNIDIREYFNFSNKSK